MRAFLLLLLLFPTVVFAQGPGGRPGGGSGPTGRFYGRVVDASNKGVEAASIVLIQTRVDTTTKQRKEVVVGGMLTPGNGDFSVENVPVMGRYTLRVTGIGYKKYEQPVAFERPSGNNQAAAMAALDKDLGNIKLEIDPQELAAVTVTGSKPLFQNGIDRKVFNVDRNITSAGGTAIDVMRNVPSINVDVDGNVSLRNNAPQIFVDGRPTNLTLEQIPADAIESIEIITNPSAKFDASGGGAGILNIVLKKNRRVGYSGNVRVNLDSRLRLGAGGDINVRQNKINFFASGMVNQRRSIGTGSTLRNTKGVNTAFSQQYDRSEVNGMFGFGRAGFDYFINNRNTITLAGSFARGRMNPEVESDIFVDQAYLGNPLASQFNDRFSESANKFRNSGLQLSYKRLFTKAGREWTADVTLNRGRNNTLNTIGNDYFTRTSASLPYVFSRNFTQRQLGGGDVNNLTLQTDYVNPLGENSKWEAGLRLNVRILESFNRFELVKSSVITNQPERDVLFESEDRVSAAYTTFTSKVKNFGYQLGLRAESSQYEGILMSKAQRFDIDFPLSFFPSIFLSQKFNDYNDMTLNYSRRINRPNFGQLFPFTDYSDSLNISRGNPGLQPEFTNSLELSYNKQFKNKDNIIASVYFKNTNDLITRFLAQEFDSVLNNVALVNTFINANSSYTTGLELTSRNKINKVWEVTSNANFFTSKIDLANSPDPDQFLSYFFKINNQFRLPHNLSFQFSANYTSRIISSPGGGGGGSGGGGGGGGGGPFGGGGGGSASQGFIRANYGVDAAVRWEFLKTRTAAISLNVNDIFRTRVFDSYSASDLFEQNLRRRRDPQVFRLNFSYRFGKFDASLFRRRSNKGDGGDDGGIQPGI